MIPDYKVLYEALIKDVREHCKAYNCEICVGATLPCTIDCDIECDTCVSKCRCYECRNGDKWKWRGDNEPNSEDD